MLTPLKIFQPLHLINNDCSLIYRAWVFICTEIVFLFIYHFSHFRVTCTLFKWPFARLILWCRDMVFNATFNTISVISWRLVVQEIRWNRDRMKKYMINVILYGRNCISLKKKNMFFFIFNLIYQPHCIYHFSTRGK